MSRNLALSLGRTAEYALRAMCHLALAGDGAPIRASALSEATAVPLPYLSKVMRQLAEAGLVDSSKGHGGGFRLARPPARIAYRDVLAAVGYGTGPRTCVFGWDSCRDDRPCPMHPSWVALGGYFSAWAGETTLATLAGRKPPEPTAARHARGPKRGARSARRRQAP